jgi:hypothetical protein
MCVDLFLSISHVLTLLIIYEVGINIPILILQMKKQNNLLTEIE